MTKELQLFIIWKQGRALENKILHNIAENFEIIKTFNIIWNKHFFSENLTRFYGKSLPPRCKKIRECGTGSFLLITVYDHKPLYVKHVNINMSNAKYQYRQWCGGGYLVHASDNAEECNENLLLLLGIDTTQFMQNHKTPWNGEHIEHKSNLIGTSGWQSQRDFLRIIAQIPSTSLTLKNETKHLKTTNISRTCRLLNAKRAFPFIKKNWYKVLINNKHELIKITKSTI